MGHHHHHDHHHAPGDPPCASTARPDRRQEWRRLWMALALTAAILVAEVLGALWSGSLALLSDAGHVLSDLAAQGLSLLAIAIATRPPDARRTFGYHRVEILAALLNGTTLVGLAAWILWSGWQRLRSGAPVVDAHLMTPIAAVGLVANVAGALLLHGAHSLNARGAYLHLLGDTLSSVAVVVGGAVMWLRRGWYAIDPILSMGIGVFVAWSALRLVRDAVDVLLEAVPGDLDVALVSREIGEVAGVRAVHDVHIWTITSGLRALSAHVVVEEADLAQADRLLGEVRERLGRRFHIGHTTIQVESCRGASCPPCVAGTPT